MGVIVDVKAIIYKVICPFPHFLQVIPSNSYVLYNPSIFLSLDQSLKVRIILKAEGKV